MASLKPGIHYSIETIRHSGACTAAGPTEAGQMSNFCQRGMTEKGLPINRCVLDTPC